MASFWKKLSAAAAGILMLNICTAAGMTAGAVGTSVMSADQITRDMGVGWNLGNSLDANSPGKYYDDLFVLTESETQWNNPAVTEQLIQAVKNKGFNTIRIPTTWYQHIKTTTDSSGKKVYTINRNWLLRVQQVVDYAYLNDMYVILNVHHETWINRPDFGESSYAEISEELKQVWKQIATFFKDYDQHLIFEGMNEPRAAGTDPQTEWSTTDPKLLETIDKLNQDFVDTVRSVTSDYRTTRLLMVPSYAASADAVRYRNMVIPSGGIDADKDGDDDYVAVSLHAYKPFEFCMDESKNDHTEWTAAHEKSLTDLFKEINDYLVSKGVPVVIGEFSSSNFDNAYTSERVEWAESYMTKAKSLGIPCVLWDNNVASGGGEAHGYINRTSLDWRIGHKDVAAALLNTYNDTGIAWNNGTIPEIVPHKNHNDLSTGENVGFDSEFIKAADKIKSGYEIAVRYTGTAPEIALMNADWGGWTTVGVSDYYPENGIAYIDCDDIINGWNDTGSGVIANIKVTNAAVCSISEAVILPKTAAEETTNDPSTATEIYSSSGSAKADTTGSCNFTIAYMYDYHFEEDDIIELSVNVSNTSNKEQWKMLAIQGFNSDWSVSANVNIGDEGTNHYTLTATVKDVLDQCGFTSVNELEGMQFAMWCACPGDEMTFSITVTRPQKPLEIVNQPANVTVNEGSITSFSVKAKGNGIRYQWQSSTNGGTTWTNCTMSGYNTATLVIANADASYNGYRFRCVITDKNNEQVTSDAAMLTVKINPTVTAPTAKTNLKYNGNAQALIDAGSTTGGTMQYSLDGKTYSTAVPTGTEAGTYTVYYKVVGNSTYAGVAARSITVSITNPAEVIGSVVIGSANVTVSYVYSGTQNVTRTETLAFDKVTAEIVDWMKAKDIQIVISFVKAFSKTDADGIELTDAQAKAIEYVLEYDYSR